MAAFTTERLVFIGLSVVIVILNIVLFQQQMIENNNRAVPYLNDKSQLGKIREAVQTVPQNEAIVVSDQAPIISYFTGYQTIVPYHVRSEKELVGFMADRNLTYLMVLENRTADGAFASIFSTTGLASLKPDFYQLGEYHSDYSNIHLYQLKEPPS